jgi:hypothetical protein
LVPCYRNRYPEKDWGRLRRVASGENLSEEKVLPPAPFPKTSFLPRVKTAKARLHNKTRIGVPGGDEASLWAEGVSTDGCLLVSVDILLWGCTQRRR